MAASDGDDGLSFRRAAWLVLPAATLAWLALSWTRHGQIWPDEIYQSLEPAHRLVFGYGFVAWEFQLGARSWVFPGLLAAVFELGRGVGLSTAAALIGLIKAFMVGLAVVGLYASMRLAYLWRGGRAALLAGVLGAAFTPTLVFAGRAMSELASGSAVTVAVLLLVLGGSGRARAAGVLAALACFLRYQSGLIALGLVVVLALSSRASLKHFLVGLLVAGVAGEILDWATWGAPFRSLIVYVRYNLQHSGEYGVEPPLYYLGALWTAAGAPVIVIALGLLRPPSNTRPILAVVIAFVVAHSFIAQKQLRFIMPIVPLALALAGVGLDSWLETLRRGRRVPWWLGGGLAVALAVPMAARVHRLTNADIGHFLQHDRRKQISVGGESEGWNRMLLEVGRRDDLCGLALFGSSPIWVGGYSYLHRDVPMFALKPSLSDADFGRQLQGANYVIAPVELPPPAPATEVSRNAWVVLYRMDHACGTPPDHYRRLFRG